MNLGPNTEGPFHPLKHGLKKSRWLPSRACWIVMGLKLRGLEILEKMLKGPVDDLVHPVNFFNFSTITEVRV